MKKLFFALITMLSVAYIPATVQGLSASDWEAGRIIDDGIFRASQTMGPENIQNFLNSKVPTCDTWGTKDGRASYGTSRGNPPPYRCLKDYYENIDTKENNLDGRPIPAGSKSAAQIIYHYAQQYRINPQVLITLLQKEQTLITDDWPWNVQYRSATGYGCPDTAPCDSQYYGFSNQVRWAAKMYQAIGDNDPNWYSPYIKGSNFIYYHPNTGGCGGTNVNVTNWSTASLYSYTPYQPNAAALNNLYGTGDGCSAYGNRNFWRLFNEWFGSTRLVNANIYLSKGLTTNIVNRPAYIGDTITASYEVTNSADYSTYVGGLGICARLNGQHYDLGFIHQNTLAAQGKVTISFSKKVEQTGNLELFICSYNDALGGWAGTFYPYNYSSPSATRSLSMSVLDNPYLTSGISLSPTRPGVGEPVTASMAIRNASNTAINIGSMVIAGRDPAGKNVDFGIVNDVIVGADWGTFNYSKSRTFTTPGKHTLYVANWNGAWSTQKPIPLNDSIIKKLTVDVIDNPYVTAGISFTPSTPTLGQPVTVTITLKNTSTSPINIGSLVVAARDPSGNNTDFKINNDVTVAANGGTYTYSDSKTFEARGTHRLFIASWNGAWSTQKPASFDESIIRQTDLLIQ